MIEILVAASSSPSSSNSINPIGLIGTFIFAALVLYLFILRPQRQRLRHQQSVQDSIEVGDDIMTSAGIFGTITDIDEETDTVTVEIAPGTEVRMSRRAVSRRLVEPPPEDEDYADEDESGGEDEDYSEESGGEEAGSQP